MIRAALIVALLCSAAAASAQERVSVMLGSRHLGGAGFQEVNPGLFLTWEDRGGLDWTVGAYRNSYGRLSVAGVAGLPLAEWSGGAFSVFAGVAHYPRDGRRMRLHVGDFVPVAGLQLRQGPAFLQVMPMDGRPVSAVATFGLTFER